MANMAYSAKDRRRRQLSQNLLTSSGVKKYLGALGTNTCDLLVEVGAGRGTLTAELANFADNVDAFELDPEFAKAASKATSQLPNVQVHLGDFLGSSVPATPFTLAGNLPFSRTNEIMRWALAARTLERAVVITQLEFARKRAGDYGRWSLATVQSWPTHDWRLVGKISRHDFRPVPKVDAGILELTARPSPLIVHSAMNHYKDLVALGFGGKAGRVVPSRRPRYSLRTPLRAFSRAEVPEKTVVAFVHPDQWLQIFNQLEP